MPANDQLNAMSNSRVRWRATWTPWAILLPLWLAGLTGVGLWVEQRELAVLRQEALRDLEVQSLSLRSIAERYKHIPYVSGRQHDVQALLASPHDRTMENRVDVYLQDVNRRAGSDALYLMNIDGFCLAASNWHLGNAGSFKNENYDFRPYFQQALARGWGVDYAVGSTTGQPGLFYASPIQVGDTRLGVMAVKVRLPELEKSWAAATSPLLLLDKRGVVILATEADYLYRTTRKLDEDELAELHYKKGQYGQEPDGSPKKFQPMPWVLDNPLFQPLQFARIPFQGRTGLFLVEKVHLADYDWTLIVTKDLSPATIARWTAIIIAGLSSIALWLGLISWRQRGLRVVEMRDHQQELENRVAQRTRDLAQANVLLKAMKDSLPVGIRIMNEDGELTDLNAKVCEITGYSEDELLHQRPPYAYWHPEEIDKHSRDLQIALEGHATPVGQEQRFRHKHGHDIQVVIYTAPLMYGGQRHGYVSSMVDITRQKQIEDKQRMQEEAMLSTAVLASMGELVFSLTHELGSPFLSISSAIEVAKRHLANDDFESLRNSLQQIGQQSQRAREIMQRIRNRVPKHEVGFSPCQVNDVVNNVLSLLKSEFRRQKTKCQGLFMQSCPPVLADHVLLEQVVLNLVMNALQAMNDTPTKDRGVLVETGQQGTEVFIRISDRGPGISPSVANQIFNLFYTTKPHGLGVGLNFCKTTIESHSGRLEFSNRDNGGTAFTIFLPVASQS